MQYPLLNIFWTTILVFLWVAWFWVLILCIRDIFRAHYSGWVKALWMIFIVVVPFLGVFLYVVAEGRHMAERDAQAAAQSQQQFDSYVRSLGPSDGTATELTKAKALLDSGAITQQEYDAIKSKALAA